MTSTATERSTSAILQPPTSSPGAINLAVFLNNGSGASGHFFATTPAATFTSGTVGISTTSSFALGDVDGDGKVDLAMLQPPTSSPGAINLAVFLNNGSGATGHFFATTPAATFTSGTVGISTTSSFALGDVDGDGKVDLEMLQPPTSSPGAINLAVFLNNDSGAAGHFFATTPAATFTSGTVGVSTTSSFALGDVDGDGKVDLAILQPPTSSPGAIDLPMFLNNGTGAARRCFATIPALTFTSGTVGVNKNASFDLGDVDGDGRLEPRHIAAADQQSGRRSNQSGRVPEHDPIRDVRASFGSRAGGVPQSVRLGSSPRRVSVSSLL